jgi:CheY-like chemotaxis protein
MLLEGHLDPILVVDDDDDLRQGVVGLLEGRGYAVAEAGDGAAALALLRRGLRPALVLLDLVMPIMDGESFCRIWQADASLSSIPVVIVSAEPTIALKAAACRANGFIAKPLEPHTLFEAIAQFAPDARTKPPA